MTRLPKWADRLAFACLIAAIAFVIAGAFHLLNDMADLQEAFVRGTE